MPATILLVDDEPALLRLMMSALTAEGYQVHQARNGVEAVALFDREGADIDLLITDMQMPYVDGPQLVERLRARRQTLKVIGISGRVAPLGGTDAFLAKPFARAELLAKVRELVGPP
jgi:two-component system cell cycle sensor histidine kinase/response regulator CckA